MHEASTRGSALNGGPGWPSHLAKDSEFMIHVATQQNQHNLP